MKRKILIASLLKPVNDIRSYEKMASSLARIQIYDIYCSGFPSDNLKQKENIHLLPLKYFNRNGIGRFLARLQTLNIYIKVKPELIIVNSSDLLIISILYRIIFGGKIIYDIQENYYRNLWYQKNYTWGIRHLLAWSIRLKEIITSPLFNHFFLAEKIYAEQLNFIGKKFLILENKSLKTTINNTNAPQNDSPQFLICGTIAKEYGVFEGINFFIQIAKFTPKATLTILGHCPNNTTYNHLIKLSINNPSIKLKLSKNPIPHTKIEDAIIEANIGLLPYLPNKSTEGKWPTKMYEFMALKLPFIIQNNSLWNDMILQTNCGLSFNFTTPTQKHILEFWKTFESADFYSNTLPNDIYWESQEVSFFNQISKSLSDKPKHYFRFI